MGHPLPAHLGLYDLHPALFTYNASMFHAFVFAAVALIILDWSEYLGAEQSVTFRLERAVIDGLRFLDFPVRPFPDFFRRSNRDFDRTKTKRVFRLCKEAVDVFQCLLL